MDPLPIFARCRIEGVLLGSEEVTPSRWFARRDRVARGLFAFAGIWERWGRGGGADPLETCALITTEANDVVRPVHARMPVILHRDDYDLWLDPKAKPDDLLALLVPYAGMMADVKVGPWVNSPRHEGPRCVEPG